jgi:hypothetical protein
MANDFLRWGTCETFDHTGEHAEIRKGDGMEKEFGRCLNFTPRPQRGSPFAAGPGDAIPYPMPKIQSMVLADESCPDCGSNQHRECQS